MIIVEFGFIFERLLLVNVEWFIVFLKRCAKRIWGILCHPLRAFVCTARADLAHALAVILRVGPGALLGLGPF